MKVARTGMLAIPSTENPEPLAMLVLDPEIISNGVAFGGSTPPFPTDTLSPSAQMIVWVTPRHLNRLGG